MSTIFKPNGERVLVKELKAEEKKTESGIILASENTNKQTLLVEVVAMGNAFSAEAIKRLGIDGGDKVEIRNMIHDQIRLDGEVFLCVHIDTILGKYEEVEE